MGKLNISTQFSKDKSDLTILLTRDNLWNLKEVFKLEELSVVIVEVVIWENVAHSQVKVTVVGDGKRILPINLIDVCLANFLGGLITKKMKEGYKSELIFEFIYEQLEKVGVIC